MNEVPEWFLRLKAEWPAAWVYTVNDCGEDCGTLTTESGVAIRAWSGESDDDLCHAVVDSGEDGPAPIFVDDLCGMTFAKLRESVAMAVSSHFNAWQEVAALVGGES